MKNFLYISLILLLVTSCSSNTEENEVYHVSDSDSLEVFQLIDSANIHRIQGKFELAKSEVHAAISKSNELNWQLGLGSAYANLSYINLYESDFESSMENAVEGLRISENCGDKRTQGLSNLLIGYVYFSLGDSSQVLPYYRKSINIRREVGDHYDTGFSYSYLGSYYFSTNQIDSAVFYHKKSLDFRRKSKDARSIADSYLLLGSAYLKKNRKDKAQEYFQEALLLYAEINDKKRLAETYRNYAEIYLEQGNLEDAENFLKQANALATETGAIDNLIAISDKLAEVKSLTGDFESAYDFLRYHVNTTRETAGESKYKDIVKNVLSYKNEKEKKIRELEFKQSEERQRFVVVSVCVFAAILLAFALFIWSRLKITRDQNKVIAQQRDKVDTAFTELAIKNKEIVDSINYAQRIQSAILPSTNQLDENFEDIFVLYKPKDIVAGDFYWYREVGDAKFIAAADCTGHGVPGAMVSVVCANALNRSVKEFEKKTPSEILDKTRELVIETFSMGGQQVKDGMDIALLKFDNNELTFAGANNPLWIIKPSGNLTEEQKEAKTTVTANDLSLIEFKGNKQPIGLFEEMKGFREVNLSLDKGDVIYIFSDGFADQFGGEKGKKFKYGPFKRKLIEISQLGMSKQRELLEQTFENWRLDIEQVDDVCVMGIRI